jgi:aminoglycoside phosphotransferase (APT) family kinase protein
MSATADSAAADRLAADRLAADRGAALTEALHGAGELDASGRVESVEQLAGGWSRHSYLATARSRGGTPRRYVIRVKPPAALLETDLRLEYDLYRQLERIELPTPRVFALIDDDDSPFGAPFIVMEHVEGAAPNTYDRDDQRRLAADWAGPRTIAEEMVGNLARIHCAPTLPTGLPALDFDAVVARWREVYETRRLLRDPVVEEAFAWVAERRPESAWDGLVHGDYRLGNVLIAGGHVSAVLDWELAYHGDVRLDLGYLAMPRAAGKHLRARSPLMATFAEQDWFMGRYAELTGRVIDAEALATFQMLGIMLLLATQFMAAWMYAAGRTEDMRMAWSRFSLAGLREDMIALMQW